ncbi:MAG: hypothetical protein ACTSWZ_07930, partial [Candidatus Heimdallarchaeaceae archaeon]
MIPEANGTPAELGRSGLFFLCRSLVVIFTNLKYLIAYGVMKKVTRNAIMAEIICEIITPH